MLYRLPTLMMQAAIILNHGCRYRMLFVTPLLLASVSLCSHDKYVYGVVYACLTAALEHSDYHACHAPKQTSCTHTQLLYVHTLHVCIMTSSAHTMFFANISHNTARLDGLSRRLTRSPYRHMVLLPLLAAALYAKS